MDVILRLLFISQLTLALNNLIGGVSDMQICHCHTYFIW